MNTLGLKNLIKEWQSLTLPRLRRLMRYYSGNHQILFDAKDPGKPQNRVVNNFCKNITDTTVGYFMGTPVTYSTDDKELNRELVAINDYNDEQFLNSRLSKDLSVYGVACELLYIDEERNIRMCPLDVTSVIPIWSSTAQPELIGAVRLAETDNEGELCLELYDEHEIAYFSYNQTTESIEKRDTLPHYFGQVPINFYFNNSDATGDFEPVISLVDAYNKLQSESVNDFELFADSYLAITGMGATDSEDIRRLRENRVLLLDDGGKAEWLTKSVNDAYIENLKSRISSDIYRFSGSVDMTDDTIGQSASGIAIKYRLLNFENRVSVTERFFKKGLCRRYEMICHLLNTLGASYDWRSIKITFTRNLPENPVDSADYAQRMSGVVSKKTLLESLPIVTDVEGELERIRKEQEGDEE
ncbi:MAG: phage portal protein [Clostridia bacterium]|nr:phage portal protein [Clostridia bacterium]